MPALVPADGAALRADADRRGSLFGEIRVGFPGDVLFVGGGGYYSFPLLFSLPVWTSCVGGGVHDPGHRLPPSRVDITVGREDPLPSMIPRGVGGFHTTAIGR